MARRKLRGFSPTLLSSTPSARKPRRPCLETLETRCVFAAPTLEAIGNQTVFAGAPLMIALDGFDADGDAITYTVTSDNPSITPQISSASNRSLRIEVPGYGIMEFELFEDLSPRTTQHIIQLAQSGFYDGVKFHRIIPGFVIQGGDPTGTGQGGSPLGDFDDEFNLLLQHTSKGVLSMAKTTDDTNDSQFFITAAPTRHLDFNHSIFGFLTSGESVRAAIDAQGTPGGTPQSNIVMSNVDVFTDIENGVLRISAPHGFTGSGNITVTASDGNGGTVSRTFAVNVVADNGPNTNGSPFLGPVEDAYTLAGSPVTIPVNAFDVEGDSIQFSATSSNPAVTVAFASPLVVPANQTATSNLVITPASGFTGTVNINITVRAPGSSVTDNQTIQLKVAGAPTGVQLLTDTGSSASDNVTRLNNSPGNPLSFRVNGVIPGAVVTLFSDGVQIGQATSSAETVDITTDQTATISDGPRSITAVQSFNGSTSGVSPALNITVDSVSPSITSTAPATVAAGAAYSYQVEIAAGTGGSHLFALTSAPSGMTINPQTGLISWAPNASQTGAQSATIEVTDLAGNVGTQSFQVTVTNSPPAITAIPDQQADELDEFLLNVSANDPNLPADQLTFHLLDAPAGATIDSSTGAFRFTPSETQGGATFNVTVRVTDAAGEFDTESFAIHVDEVFQAPVLDPIGPQNARVGEPYTFQASATDSDVPAEGLTFSLDAGGPPGLTIDPATGLLSWTPAAADEFKTFAVTVRVTDSNGLFDSESFNISVNAPPRLADIADAAIDEGVALIFGVTATHNLPITFSLEPGAPAGATIDASSGLFVWTPSEAQGPGTFTISVKVTDTAGLSDVKSFTVTVEEVNAPPVFSAIGDSFVIPGGSVSFPISATDADIPSNGLTYTLETSPVAGATIDATTGLFVFAPAADTPQGVYTFTVRVTDSGAASALMTFDVTVTSIGFALFGITAEDIPDLDSAIDSLATESATGFSRIPLAGNSFFAPAPLVLETGIQTGEVPKREELELDLELNDLDGGLPANETPNPTSRVERTNASERRTTLRPVVPARKSASEAEVIAEKSTATATSTQAQTDEQDVSAFAVEEQVANDDPAIAETSDTPIVFTTGADAPLKSSTAAE